jgi:purine-binding chemotaxis protein CheW
MTERTSAITKRAPALPASGNAREYLAFELGAAHYALPLSCVREIVRVPRVTEVPRAPRHVLGVISIRGAVTTAFDLRVWLRLADAPLTNRSRVLLIDGGREVVGLLVDNVLQVHRLHDAEIELAGVLGSEAPPYLFGIGRPQPVARAAHEGDRTPTATDFLLLLDPNALLRSEFA